MVIAGLVVLLVILGMFLQMLTMSPENDREWQIDTEGELPTTVVTTESDSTPMAA
jgi:hypothetical protein